MILEIFLFLIFVIIIVIQVLLWCQILAGFAMHWKFRRTLQYFAKIKPLLKDDDRRGYA